jgi:integrase/recombinase XerD
MKRLLLFTPGYQRLFAEYQTYLKLLGYQKGSRKNMAAHVKEFLNRLESQQITGLQEITAHQITDHYQYLQNRPSQRDHGTLSESHISFSLYAIRVFIQYHYGTGSITADPFSALNFPKPYKQERKTLSRQEIKQLYEVCETHRDKAILGLFYGCGLRRSEAERLNTDDINYKQQILYVREGKGNKRRAVPINKQLKEDFYNYYVHERNHFLFIGNNIRKEQENSFMLNKAGGRMLGDGYWKWLKGMLGKAGLSKDATLHHLRHTIATHLLENGLDIEQVREFLGHSFLETTQIYTHIGKWK